MQYNGITFKTTERLAVANMVSFGGCFLCCGVERSTVISVADSTGLLGTRDPEDGNSAMIQREKSRASRTQLVWVLLLVGCESGGLSEAIIISLMSKTTYFVA